MSVKVVYITSKVLKLIETIYACLANTRGTGVQKKNAFTKIQNAFSNFLQSWEYKF